MPRKKKVSMLKLRLVRSMHGSKPRLKATIQGLGFRRTNQVVERPDTPEIRGMVAKVVHWVEVVEGADG
jgi:large subunit ribosomal protein L30